MNLRTTHDYLEQQPTLPQHHHSIKMTFLQTSRLYSYIILQKLILFYVHKPSVNAPTVMIPPDSRKASVRAAACIKSDSNSDAFHKHHFYYKLINHHNTNENIRKKSFNLSQYK